VTTNINEEAIASSTYRVIDANINRLREGIRVIEDIYRYIYNNKSISQQLKKLRHQIRTNDYNRLIYHRNIKNDILKETTSSEQKRDNIEHILISNYKRAQESSRVLEEILKLIDIKSAQNFKEIRYQLYDLEKEISNTPNFK